MYINKNEVEVHAPDCNSNIDDSLNNFVKRLEKGLDLIAIIDLLTEIATDTIIHYNHTNAGDFHTLTMYAIDKYIVIRIPSYFIKNEVLKEIKTIDIYYIHPKAPSNTLNFKFFSYFYIFITSDYRSIIEEDIKRIGDLMSVVLDGYYFGLSFRKLLFCNDLKTFRLLFNNSTKDLKPATTTINVTFNN